MTLIAILICLLMEIFLANLRGFRRYEWFLDYISRVKKLFGESTIWSGPAGILVILIPPLLLIGILDSVFSDTWLGLLELGFGVCVLAYCFRYQSMDHAIDQYIEGCESDEDENIAESCEYILGRNDTSSHQAREIADAIIIQVNERIFSVLFWFVLLGPLGALLFRLTWIAAERADEYDWADAGFKNAAHHLYGILAWIPARLLAAAYALVGSYEAAMNGWRDCNKVNDDSLAVSNDKILLCVGSGAMNIDGSSDNEEVDHEQDVDTMISARGMVLRALLVWVIVIAVTTLAGWMS